MERGIDTAGLLYGGLVWFSILGDYVIGRKSGWFTVPYHPIEQIFDGDTGFVLH